jgi:GNAT superfamily N-acetyltransferase
VLNTSIDVADEYWAADFGCEREQLRPSGPLVKEHAGGLSDYAGASILVLGASPLISVPSALFATVAARAAQLATAAVRDPAALQRLLLPGSVTRVIGPALLNYADGSCSTPAGFTGGRELSASDASAFLNLKAACPADDWEAKGFALDAQPTFGAFASDGKLMALATFAVWANRIAHLVVVARPEARNRGFGTRAVAAATQRALELGLLPQYRVLEPNVASRRIAAKLGFQPYGYTVAARLAPL